MIGDTTTTPRQQPSSRIPTFYLSEQGAVHLLHHVMGLKLLFLQKKATINNNAVPMMVEGEESTSTGSTLQQQHNTSHDWTNDAMMAAAASAELSSFLCEIVDTFVDNGALQMASLEVLFLLNSEALQTRTEASLFHLFRQLKTFDQDLKTQQVGCLWMLWIAKHEPAEVFQALILRGAIEIVLAAMERFPSNMVIVNTTLEFLERVYVHQSQENADGIEAFGGSLGIPSHIYNSLVLSSSSRGGSRPTER
jgi:hypothetical protein